jgi:hypothetical protein
MRNLKLTLSHRPVLGLVAITKVPIYQLNGQEVTKAKWLQLANAEQITQLSLFIKTLNQ